MVKSSLLGYPRIGENREWKKALESYWNGNLDEQAFLTQLKEIRLQHLRKQQELGIDLIPVNDFSLYDHVLDTATMFGIVPTRFNYDGGPVSPTLYYQIARGSKEAPASEMTKWFNTNYHYIVPELNEVKPSLTENKPLQAYKEALSELNIKGKPVVLGLLTLLKLSKGSTDAELDGWIDKLLPLYIQVLQELANEGVEWVQLDEPILVQELSAKDIERVNHIYKTIAEAVPTIKIILQTYFEAVEQYAAIIALPVHAIGLDFVHGAEQNIQSLQESGFPQDKVLAIGIVDGRNIWKAKLDEQLTLLQQIGQFVSADRIIIQPSCSLLHVPVSLNKETALPAEIKNVLAYADEKITEVKLLSQFDQVEKLAEQVKANQAAYAVFNALEERNQTEIHKKVEQLKGTALKRGTAFAQRYEKQQEQLKLPILPTTTIGSFPQTPEVRNARQLWRKGTWDEAKYNAFIQEQIDLWIAHQEELGLDVLVHGEFERTDMVEFFGEKLGGFFFTKNGWVQSYGSRCVKPPVIYGDVKFIEPMTVKETVYAQSKTDKPVKGMLTGPITIMNWSFVRQDLPREVIAYQLAYALRQEVEALEAAGIAIIQVDEPAVREGLPLKLEEQKQYLNWAIKAFRMTTCSVQDVTQIHTHMCYCEFHDMIQSISDMDADVISIETSRSHGELIESFEDNTYQQGIGLGVYDIHSPRLPQVEEMTSMIERALKVLSPKIFWINPDCGLKTRKEEETIGALRNMVIATNKIREQLKSTV